MVLGFAVETIRFSPPVSSDLIIWGAAVAVAVLLLLRLMAGLPTAAPVAVV
jgi:hypothetical protein